MLQHGFNGAAVIALCVAVYAALVGGPPGPAGASIVGRQGVGIDDVVMHGGGHLIVMLTDGRRIDLGRVIGERGAPGELGPPGPRGPQGLQGPPAPAPARGAHGKRQKKAAPKRCVAPPERAATSLHSDPN